MPTISQANKALTGLFLLLLLHPTSLAKTPCDQAISNQQSNTYNPIISTNSKKHRFDKKTKNYLKTFSKISSLDEGKMSNNHILLIGEKPSNPTTRMGFCGSGIEETLILLKKNNSILSLKDSVLLTSCLKSLEIDNEKGLGTYEILSNNKKNSSIFFKYLGENQQREISIKNSKISIKPSN